jgi:hypothetical protein
MVKIFEIIDKLNELNGKPHKIVAKLYGNIDKPNEICDKPGEHIDKA